MSLAIINHNNVDIEVLQIDNEYYIAESDITLAIGASRNAVREQRRRNPEIYREGRHYLMHTNRVHNTDRIVWSFRGLSRLLMRMNTQLAIQFQDRLEDFLEGLRTGEVGVITRDEMDALMTLNKDLREQLSNRNQKYELLEEQVRQIESRLQTINTHEQKEIKKRVEVLVLKLHRLYRTPLTKLYPQIWGDLHHRYEVGSYKEIKRDQIISVIMYLEGRIDWCFLQEKQIRVR